MPHGKMLKTFSYYQRAETTDHHGNYYLLLFWKYKPMPLDKRNKQKKTTNTGKEFFADDIIVYF